VNLRRNAEFRQAYSNAYLVTADGMPVYLYARFRGSAVQERVTGSDLLFGLAQELPRCNCRCFFVPSSKQTAELLVELFARRGLDRDAIETVVPPFGFEKDTTYTEWLLQKIREHRTTHLFFGVGAPKSEIWADKHSVELGNCYVLCAGAGLDMLAGIKRRAPLWVQRYGLEWFWRFCMEPRRLFLRYFVSSWRFVAAVIDDLRSRTIN
jgi:N-acetylglucosaminyldiphosphoundecaprenol N-acetyl-beta-D-mannosaminyltransferase